MENWNSANTVLHYGKDSALTGPDKEHAETNMLALHLLQSSRVHHNMLLLQQVLAEPAWAKKLSGEDPHGLTALFWSNVNLCGTYRLDMDKRLDLRSAAAVPRPRTSVDVVTSTGREPGLSLRRLRGGPLLGSAEGDDHDGERRCAHDARVVARVALCVGPESEVVAEVHLAGAHLDAGAVLARSHRTPSTARTFHHLSKSCAYDRTVNGLTSDSARLARYAEIGSSSTPSATTTYGTTAGGSTHCTFPTAGSAMRPSRSARRNSSIPPTPRSQICRLCPEGAVNRTDGRWLAQVCVPARSANGRSELDLWLWVDAAHVTPRAV